MINNMSKVSTVSRDFYESYLIDYLKSYLSENEIDSLISNILKYVIKLTTSINKKQTEKYNIVISKILNSIGFFQHNKKFYSIVDDPIVDPKYIDIAAVSRLDVHSLITVHDTFALYCYIGKLIDDGYPSERCNVIIEFFNYLNLHPHFAIQSIYTKYMKSYLLESGCFKELLYRSDKNSSYVNWTLIKTKRTYNAIVIKLLKRIDNTSELYADNIINELSKNTAESIKFIAQLGEKKVVDLVNTEKVRTIQATLNKRANAKVKKGITNHYTCSHCGNNECEKTEYQSRSLDESSTTLIVCVTCKHSWHIN